MAGPKYAYKEVLLYKGIGVLTEIKLGSINKKGLLKNELPKGDLRGLTITLLGVISFPT